MFSKHAVLFVFFAIAGLFIVPQGASALSFQPSTGSPITIAPPNHIVNALATADLDGNGNDDIISVGENKGIYVFMADNDGEGFTPKPGSPFGSGSAADRGDAAVLSGQFGGDSATDLIVMNYPYSNPYTFETYIGNGDGTFPASPAHSLQLPWNPSSGGGLTAKDVNDDGWPDLVVGLGDHKFQVGLGSSTGQFTWTPESPINVPTAANENFEYFIASAVGDWNGDGDQDVALSGYNLVTNQQNAVYTANGDGTGAFAPGAAAVYNQGFAEFIEGIATVDLNGDAYDDLAISSVNTERIKTLVGTASGLVPNPDDPDGIDTGIQSRPGDLAIADFTGDGFDDIGAGLWGSRQLAVAESGGDGSITTAAGSPFNLPPIGGLEFRPNRIDSGDFNGDGAPDLAATASNGSNPALARGIEVMMNTADPVAAPAALDFPVTGIDDTSDPMTVNLKNDGGAPLVIDSITNPGDTDDEFTLDTSSCPTTLASNDACEIEVTFSPETYGTPTSALLFTFGGGVGSISVPITGHTPAAASVSPAGGLDYGEVISGYAPGAKTLDLTYTSVGGEDLVLGNPVIGSFDAADFQIVDPTDCADPIPSGSSCTISVKFAPAANVGGFREASFDFATGNDPDPPGPVTLGGYAVPAEYNVTPASFDFGEAKIGPTITRTPQTFTLNSTGDGDVAFTGVELTGPDADSFQITGNTCPAVIERYDGTCTFSVTFDPKYGSASTRNATLEVDAFSSDHPTTPATVALTGTATSDPPPVLKPNFSIKLKSAGKVKRGKALVVTATVRNTGQGAATPLSIKATVPKRFAKVTTAIKIASLAPGKSVTRKLKIKVKKTAKKGKKLKVKVTATSGTQKRTGTRTVRVR